MTLQYYKTVEHMWATHGGLWAETEPPQSGVQRLSHKGHFLSASNTCNVSLYATSPRQETCSVCVGGGTLAACLTLEIFGILVGSMVLLFFVIGTVFQVSSLCPRCSL